MPPLAAVLTVLNDWFIWDRAALEHGQLWRLVTASLVHLTWSHAFANAVGLVLWWRLEGLANMPMAPRSRLAAFVIGSALVHIGILGATNYDWYAGASATLYGLFAYTALRCGWRGGVMLSALLLWLSAGPRVVEYSFPVAVQAHWVGLAVGVCAGVVFWARRHRWPVLGLPS